MIWPEKRTSSTCGSLSSSFLLVQRLTAVFWENRSLGDTSVKIGTHHLWRPLFDLRNRDTWKSKMAAPEIQDVRPKTCFFLYNSKCIDFKTHKCIKVEYKVGHCGHFGTRYVSVSISVLEIQHIGTPESIKVPIFCISRTVIDTNTYLVPKYPQCQTLYSTLICLWVLKSMHLELKGKTHFFGQTSWISEAAILEFRMASSIFEKSGIWRVHVQIFFFFRQDSSSAEPSAEASQGVLSVHPKVKMSKLGPSVNIFVATITFQHCYKTLGHGVHQSFTGCHWNPLPLPHDKITELVDVRDLALLHFAFEDASQMLNRV